MSLVLDSSFTVAWLNQDEVTASIQAVFDRVALLGAIVPSLWRWEVANALTVAVRRGRMTAEHRDGSLADLSLLNIISDATSETTAWRETLRLADRHGLTVYDAAYLELAIRLHAPLATLDAALIGAAGRQGVPVLS